MKKPLQPTTSSKAVGTRLYMSPEQEKSDPALDQRSDLFSLGLVLFEMLTGRKFKESNVADRKLGRRTPRSISVIVNKTLRLDPAQRYQTAAEFEVVLQRAPEYCAEAFPSSLASGNQCGQASILMATVGIALMLLGTSPKFSEPRLLRLYRQLLEYLLSSRQ